MSQGYFIAATGTGIGKTLVTAALAWQLTREGRRAMALKPVISGFGNDEAESDTAQLLRSLGRKVDAEGVQEVSPWRFAAPLSPDMAARREGRMVTAGEVIAYCRAAARDAEVLLVEGVGGVMAPLNERETMLEVMAGLPFKIILVAGSYLGTLSHTLTALAALASRSLVPHAIVISESPESPVPLAELCDTLRRFLPEKARLLALPRLRGEREKWKHCPPLTELVSV